MKNTQKINSKKSLLVVCIFMLGLSLALNGYFLWQKRVAKLNTLQNEAPLFIDADQKIADIEAYLDTISPSYTADEQSLAKQDGISSWGCGPSSYALAKLLNAKFFDNKLTIDASYREDGQYKIIEQMGLADGSTGLIDHAWLEVYFKDKFLFIDPTIGQFGKINKIAYEVFSIGQSDISATLKSKYNIEDIRINRLVSKMVNRIPLGQPPYPGIGITQDALNYFIQIGKMHDDINKGIEPDDWTEWVAFLMKKYS